MEENDRGRIAAAVKENFELRKLYLEHEELEGKILQLENRPFLLSGEDQELKALKFKKLRGVETMLQLLNQLAPPSETLCA